MSESEETMRETVRRRAPLYVTKVELTRMLAIPDYIGVVALRVDPFQGGIIVDLISDSFASVPDDQEARLITSKPVVMSVIDDRGNEWTRATWTEEEQYEPTFENLKNPVCVCGENLDTHPVDHSFVAASEYFGEWPR